MEAAPRITPVCLSELRREFRRQVRFRPSCYCIEGALEAVGFDDAYEAALEAHSRKGGLLVLRMGPFVVFTLPLEAPSMTSSAPAGAPWAPIALAHA